MLLLKVPYICRNCLARLKKRMVLLANLREVNTVFLTADYRLELFDSLFTCQCDFKAFFKVALSERFTSAGYQSESANIVIHTIKIRQTGCHFVHKIESHGTFVSGKHENYLNLIYVTIDL